MPNFVWNKIGRVGSAAECMLPKLAAVSTRVIHFFDWGFMGNTKL
ncbi:hypothetical protein [Shewanella sp.]|nr:hypothetical protein [Shewanella sp.]